MSAVALCAALGLVSVAVADVASRHGYLYAKASPFFWLGLLVIFVPIAFRVLMQDTDRQERLTLVVLLGVALYLVKVLGSPHAFTYSDEYVHLRNTLDILRTHHLFSPNPLLPTAAYYPGLSALTAGLVNLTGLSPFVSGLLVIGVARVLFCASFFLIAEKVTGSDRAAAGASLVYAANPMFLFWGAAFSYENLALPLAAFVVWWLGRTRQGDSRPALAVTTIAIVAVAVTHHVVGLALSALLVAWWLVERFTQRPSAARRAVGLMALVASATTLAWLFSSRDQRRLTFFQQILPACGRRSLYCAARFRHVGCIRSVAISPRRGSRCRLRSHCRTSAGATCGRPSSLAGSEPCANGCCRWRGCSLSVEPSAATCVRRSSHIGPVLGVRLCRAGVRLGSAGHRHDLAATCAASTVGNTNCGRPMVRKCGN